MYKISHKCPRKVPKTQYSSNTLALSPWSELNWLEGFFSNMAKGDMAKTSSLKKQCEMKFKGQIVFTFTYGYFLPFQVLPRYIKLHQVEFTVSYKLYK